MSEEPCSRDQWTGRQRQVLDLLARGRTNPEIADELGVSLAGAKWHVSEVLSKLGVSSREEAAEIWRAENRVLPRAGRRLRALIGMPAALAVTAAGTLGVAALAGFAAFGGSHTSQAGDVPAPPQATETAPDPRDENGTADMTIEEATELAYELGGAYLDQSRQLSAPNWDVLRLDGRDIEIDDLIMVRREFRPTDPGSAPVPLPDTWRFEFTLSGFLHPEPVWGVVDLGVNVQFTDGSRRLTAAGAGIVRVETALPGVSEGLAVPRIALIDDWNGNRATLSLYGPAGEPCLRLDQTATPGSVDHYCTSGLTGNVPGLIALPAGGVAGAAGPEVTRVTILQEDGTTVDVPSVDAPGPYAGRLRPFLLLHALPGTLQLWGARGELLQELPLTKPGPTQPPPAVHSIGYFERAATGPNNTPHFTLSDPSLLYAFLLDIPEDTAHLRITAECDAGTELVLDRTGRVTPQDRGLVVTFPPGSTTCRLLVDVPADVSWRIQPK
ncbi:MAG: helix-turn-helix transcriptional regulator [Dehalococcoidia bacterium]|nr:helix-turn-helix transcriptional regulator [Dehalococcoidia bacterium]